MPANTDTIAAIATASGRAGVGIVRISGPHARDIAQKVLQLAPKPRYAHYGPMFDRQGEVIDHGIALMFHAPHSFTGEDVLELQAHGGPVILDLLLKQVVATGARLAKPGEFSERAFLNDKIDLVQAEAIADLIDAASEQAARCAVRSLQGAFSNRIHALVDDLIHLRMYVEAAIDFPEEEIDFFADGKVEADLAALISTVDDIFCEANQGSLLRDGMNVVIAGKPNAGKSSLLNALAGHDAAIVTPIAGTTRDVLREAIHLDGMPLHIIDTAGLRESPDEVEQIGIERAWREIERADRILLLVDASTSTATNPQDVLPEFVTRLSSLTNITLVRNKIDLSGETPGIINAGTWPVITLSARDSEGVDILREHLKACVGFESSGEGGFIARRRHLDALERTRQALRVGQAQLLNQRAGELLAEDLRAAQDALGEITGVVRPDDLLGHIFSRFCIGK